MLDDFFILLSTEPDSLSFSYTIRVIDQHYHHFPTAFQNGELLNQAGENNGSCKILAFAQLHQLSEAQTLQLFGEYYRQVMDTPAGNDHQNIRNFQRSGWSGVKIFSSALKLKDN